MNNLMKCGHTTQQVDTDGKPVCMICFSGPESMLPETQAQAKDRGSDAAHQWRRDYIATHALQGMLANAAYEPNITEADVTPCKEPGSIPMVRYSHSFQVSGASRDTYKWLTTNAQRMARDAYEYADALIAEGKKP